MMVALAFYVPAQAQPRSGYADASPETRAMQDDDSANPAFLWIRQGEELWTRTCQSCHDAPATMRGVAARYPAFDPATARPVTLAGRIQSHNPVSGEALLALTALVGLQSRGLPVRVSADERLQPFVTLGKTLFHRRQGQVNLSCANCHDERAGERLGGSLIPQGHANGYPEYRLEWQALGDFSRRLRSCMNGVRAEPYPAGSTEAVALELYLNQRATGLTIETPAVRP